MSTVSFNNTGNSFIIGIVLEAYSPLGNPGNPFLGGKEPKMLEDPVIKEIARKNAASIAQVHHNACI